MSASTRLLPTVHGLITDTDSNDPDDRRLPMANWPEVFRSGYVILALAPDATGPAFLVVDDDTVTGEGTFTISARCVQPGSCVAYGPYGRAEAEGLSVHQVDGATVVVSFDLVLSEAS